MKSGIELTMDGLLADGFSKKLAAAWLGVVERENANPIFDPDYREWAHHHGFYAIDAYAFGLDEHNVDDYLSDYDYHRCWPLNSWQKFWIDDKMTMKFMLAGTEFGDLMPEYYFYNKPGQGPVPLMDAHGKGGYEGLLEVLREKGEFACKPCNGQRATGFHKLGYADGQYFVDNQPGTEADVCRYLDEHPNDIITEFFHPGMGLEKVSPVIHTLRVLTVNPTATDPHFAGTYFRFAGGTNGDDSKANYIYPDKADVYDINVDFNLQTGEYGNGELIYPNRVVKTETHPETGGSFTGKIDCWPALRDKLERLTLRLGLIEWMGYDVCFTDHGPKIIEINSHSGVKYLQCYHPFWKDPFLANYFGDKLARIDALVAKGDPQLLARRNNGGAY